jgi:GxxExxY protein
MELNDLTYRIIGCAYKVHKKLGPGLLESTYEACLEYELARSGLDVRCQVALPVIYDDIRLEAGYRIDMIVEDMVILEIKSVDKLAPVHMAQVMTYLKLSNRSFGLLINFNEDNLREGIKRVVNSRVRKKNPSTTDSSDSTD